MSPSAIIWGIVVLIVLGLFGYTNYKSYKACAPSYELKILKAQQKNREIELAYHKSAAENAKQIAGEAEKQAEIEKAKYNALKKSIDALVATDDTFIDGKFLRDLERLRQ